MTSPQSAEFLRRFFKIEVCGLLWELLILLSWVGRDLPLSSTKEESFIQGKVHFASFSMG
uniref:Uncharacterized protein n=1 Tax=Picea glauca TaxID=3330 RepID=A0A101M248_PICGL|nr:hypothetical protein ABT39_MTgene2895 [Picea glauca]QHR87571.1 hypothetical protein Q903MT_gene1582 [Picea sitchensis]